jgi:predicted nucleic acid-binding protein
VKAVADAGPIIHLSWIGQLGLFSALFEEVLVPPAVQHEVTRAGPHVPGIEAIRTAFTAGSLHVQPVKDSVAVDELQRAIGLDRGESEAIVLLREAGSDVLLIDERRARAYAEREILPVTGTIGILLRARDRSLIRAAAPVVEELRLRGFWVSADLVERIRQGGTRYESSRATGKRIVGNCFSVCCVDRST